MPYTRYTPEQKAFVKQHYATYSNAELAAQLGIETPEKVRALASRLGVKWRAENGAPRWRERKPDAAPQPRGRQSIWLY